MKLSNLNGKLSSYSIILDDIERNIKKLTEQLAEYELKLKEYEQEEKEIKDAIERLINNLKTDGNKVLELLRVGMTQSEFNMYNVSKK